MDTGMVLDDYLTRPQYDINRLLNPKEFIWIFDNILVGQVNTLLFGSSRLTDTFRLEDSHGHPLLDDLALGACSLTNPLHKLLYPTAF